MKRITSPAHPLVKHWVKLQKNRSYRYSCKRALVEGKKQVVELCSREKAGRLAALSPLLLGEALLAEERLIVSEQVMRRVSCLEEPEGVFAEVPLPEESDLSFCRKLLALDRIADPGNLGTLVRTAFALGWEGLFFLDGCCDPFNDKAIRASKGAVFRIPFARGGWSRLETFLSPDCRRLAASMEGGPPALWPRSESGRLLLVLGSESSGISEEARARCELVSIPMNPLADSLNVAVAGGILMYSL